MQIAPGRAFWEKGKMQGLEVGRAQCIGGRERWLVSLGCSERGGDEMSEVGGVAMAQPYRITSLRVQNFDFAL